MEISSQPCLITGGSDLEDSWSILRFCSSQTQEDSPLILLSSTIAPKCLKHAVSENHRKPIPFSSPFSSLLFGDLHRFPWVSTQWGAAVGALLGLRLWSLRLRRWCSHCHSYGSCSCGNLHCECRTAGISQWGYQPYHGDIMGIWEEYLIILQHITTYYKMEPKLSMWQNDANITLAKLLEVHGIQLAHLVDSTYRLVDPHVRC